MILRQLRHRQDSTGHRTQGHKALCPLQDHNTANKVTAKPNATTTPACSRTAVLTSTPSMAGWTKTKVTAWKHGQPNGKEKRKRKNQVFFTLQVITDLEKVALTSNWQNGDKEHLPHSEMLSWGWGGKSSFSIDVIDRETSHILQHRQGYWGNRTVQVR